MANTSLQDVINVQDLTEKDVNWTQAGLRHFDRKIKRFIWPPFIIYNKVYIRHVFREDHVTHIQWWDRRYSSLQRTICIYKKKMSRILPKLTFDKQKESKDTFKPANFECVSRRDCFFYKNKCEHGVTRNPIFLFSRSKLSGWISTICMCVVCQPHERGCDVCLPCFFFRFKTFRPTYGCERNSIWARYFLTDDVLVLVSMPIFVLFCFLRSVLKDINKVSFEMFQT